MKIAIEARALSAAGSGVKTYTYELIRHLLETDRQNRYVILYDSAKAKGITPGAQEVIVSLRHEGLLPWWLNKQIPQKLQELRVDLVHFTKADVPAKKVIPTVVTIYDVIPLLLPQSQSWTRRLYWPRALQRAVRNSDHIMTISEASKHDIVRLLDVAPDKVTVTPLAIDLDFFRPQSKEEIQVFRQKYQLEKPYILFTGTRDGRKNITGLLRAFAAIAKDIPHQLVISGGKALKQDDAVTVAAELKLGERIRFLDFIPQDDLPLLYSGANLFVYPSVYEGWGLPPQEAMACGTPVIVSNGGALPEVVGEAGRIVKFTTDDVAQRLQDREFEQKLAQNIREVLTNTATCDVLRAQGLARVRQFSWEKVAQTTLGVYIKVSAK
jgi:glycosyltransferase involved in cell wall biosynthesis